MARSFATFAVTALAVLCIAAPASRALEPFLCTTEATHGTLGIETTRIWEGNGKSLNGPSLLFTAALGLPCITLGVETRLAFASSEESDNFGDGIDPFVYVHATFYEFLNLRAGFQYINFPPVSGTDPNDRGVADVYVVNGEISTPYSFKAHGKHTLTPSFSMYYYRPKGWAPILSAEEGYQIRGFLGYNWQPDDDLEVFAHAGAIYDPHRTLVFQEGVTGEFELGTKITLHRYLQVSLVGNMWVQERNQRDGPPVFKIPTPVGTLTLDAREDRDQFSGRAQLLFTVPFHPF